MNNNINHSDNSFFTKILSFFKESKITVIIILSLFIICHILLNKIYIYSIPNFLISLGISLGFYIKFFKKKKE